MRCNSRVFHRGLLLFFIGVYSSPDAAYGEEERSATPSSPTAPDEEAVQPSVALRQRLFTTQTYFSPTGLLLPEGETRITVSELVLQQLNAGLSDSIQLGINTTFFILLGADLKFALTPSAVRFPQALLVGFVIPTISVNHAGVYARYALTYAGERTPYFLNLSLGVGSAGRTFTLLREEAGETRLFSPDSFVYTASLAGFFPLGKHFLLGGEYMILVFRRDRDSSSLTSLGVRYLRESVGVGLALVTLWERELLENYFIGFPFVDFQLRFD